MIGNKDIVIIAPHADDEIIGCFEIMCNHPTTILFMEEMDSVRKVETSALRHLFVTQGIHHTHKIPEKYKEIIYRDKYQFFFPDPIYETHPSHRKWGHVGEEMLRAGFHVVFYNTNMTAPYIREVKNPKKKRDSLNSVYTTQSDLWKYDHKYFLFEGYTKWILQP